MDFFKWTVTKGFLIYIKDPLFILCALFVIILALTGILVFRALKKEKLKEDPDAQRPAVDTCTLTDDNTGD